MDVDATQNDALSWEAVPLLDYNEGTGKHSLNEQGLQVLSECAANFCGLAIVSVVGAFRTGKSYLMNRLAHGLCKQSVAMYEAKKGAQGAGSIRTYSMGLTHMLSDVQKIAQKSVPPASFKVGHSQNSTTHGIKIYRLPIPFHSQYLEGNDDYPPPTCVLVLDTEGLASPERSRDYDQKIYGLAMMLSSVMILNAGPTFSREGFDTLDMASDVLQKMSRQSHNNGSAAKIQPGDYFPSLYWVMRDTNGLEFSNPGNTSNSWSPTDQLLHSLKLYDGTKMRPPGSPSLYKLFGPPSDGSTFSGAQCFALPKPATNERTMQNLELCHDELLSPSFVVECDKLVDAVVAQCIHRPKIIEKNILSADIVLNMLHSFIDQLNASPSAVPLLADSWQCHVKTEQREYILDICYIWAEQTAPLKSIFPDILTFGDANQLYSDICSNQVIDYKAKMPDMVLDPTLLEDVFRFAYDLMYDALGQRTTKSVYLDTSVIDKAIETCKRQGNAILLVARQKLEAMADQIIATMPFPQDPTTNGKCSTHHTLKTCHQMWLDTLLSFYQQANHCNTYNSLEGDLDPSWITVDHDWQKLSPKSLHMLWSKEYAKRVLPIISRLHLENPIDTVVEPSNEKMEVETVTVPKKELPISGASYPKYVSIQPKLVLRLKLPVPQ